MSSHFKVHLGRVLVMLPATIALLCGLSTAAAAQDQPAPKWEIFGGYSFVYPNTNVHGTLPLGLVPLTSQMEANPRGVGVSVTYNFTRWFGLTADTSTHWGSGENTLAARIDDAAFSNVSLGPKITFRSRHFSPFLEALVGDHRLTPDAFHDIDRLGFMFGGGLDINVSRHVALRLLRADYVMSSYNFGPRATTPTTDLRGVRLQTGLNFMFGGEETRVLPSAECSVRPSEIFAGEPVTATASGNNFNPRRTIKYTWSGTGVHVGGTGASLQIDTTGLQPGMYGVTASLNDGSKYGSASCSARFTVRSQRGPVISCSPDPASVPMGGTSTISSNASSPDGRRLTYSYTASAGDIRGNTSTATLDTRGANPGTITVNCNVSDDRNPALTASATTSVNVQTPPPPPPPPDTSAIERRLAIHSIYFATAKPTREHPDGGLVASQENTLSVLAADFKTLLQSKPNARLTLEGHTDPRGSVPYNQALSERRVDRAKRFLIEQGVPAADIDTKAFGKQKNLTDAEIKDEVERNPELTPEQRQKVLHNMRVIILASNRRVDIRLNIPGQGTQESVREYPFNAADALTLLDTRGGTRKTASPPAKKK
jgi:outer membrane protein OmpA-like peptidoglycan-associated protein